MIPVGRTFFKMSGSGNDFVMVDARQEPPGRLAEPDVVRRVCARGTGVGADGIVFLCRSDSATIQLIYLNADGSRAEFCGNATLCTTRLSVELGIGAAEGLTIETDSGVVSARMRAGRPEIDLPPVADTRAVAASIPLELGERRIGFAEVGVPHLVIECDDISTVDVVGRGRPLRNHVTLLKGANVNFVSRQPGGRGQSGWRMRTYERGVEAETLACGSGSVATAILLNEWGLADRTVELETSSGEPLVIRLVRDGLMWIPSLSGEGRIVYQATLSEM
jgi:diaminopimelate epimerase